MTMIRVSPLEVRVRCDWFDGMPRAIRFGPEELPVRSVERVRREVAAYTPGMGPRTCFQVVTDAGRFAIAYRHRHRRWIVEGIEPSAAQADGRIQTEMLAHAA
ncbi:MAG: hypothetical protein M0Z49_00890 [Chloroflexi bacterium]|nr:hypothetical protein [Chloroflexota bacterium]